MQFVIKAYDGKGMLAKRMEVRPRRQELDQYLANEPYMQEHVWETLEIEQMNVVIR